MFAFWSSGEGLKTLYDGDVGDDDDNIVYDDDDDDDDNDDDARPP